MTTHPPVKTETEASKAKALHNKLSGDEPQATEPFHKLLAKSVEQIALTLPRHMNPERMARIALTCFRLNPKLAECDPRSVIAAVMQASQLGLEPGLTQECALVPFGRECQLIPMFAGLTKLAMNTGRVTAIDAHVVYQADHFDISFGLEPQLFHRPELDGPRGAPRLVYGMARLTHAAEPLVDFMTRQQVYAIRDKSQGYINATKYNKPNPWIDPDQEPEMWRKTMIRRMCKRLPRSPELQSALELDRLGSLDARAQGITIDAAREGLWTPPSDEQAA